MNDFLKRYRITVRALSPLYIGDGGKIGNREYMYLSRQQKVIVPDIRKMYEDIRRKGKQREFDEFMTGEKYPLGTWLRKQGFSPSDYERWKSYELDAGDYFMPSTSSYGDAAPPKDILTFVKDPYGDPYIPGSSIKGMIRTALLSWLIRQDPSAFEEPVRGITNITRQGKTARKRDLYLKKETALLEQEAMHTLKRTEKTADAVNSIMSGLIISDSEPLSTDQLTLSQRIDVLVNRSERRLPILREALKPGTEFRFDLTIDSTIFGFSIDTLNEAMDYLNSVYYSSFGEAFGRGDPEPGIIWIGGGTGYVAKTVVYSLFKGQEAVRVADIVFQNTLSEKIYYEHHHNEDTDRGISPHTYKCTRYDGRLYDCGMARIESIQEF